MLAGVPIRDYFGVLELCEGKLSRTVLRGVGSRKAPLLPGSKARKGEKAKRRKGEKAKCGGTGQRRGLVT